METRKVCFATLDTARFTQHANLENKEKTMNTVATNLNEMRTQSQRPRESNLPEVTMGFGSLQSFELLQRAAKLLATSTIVPKDYQGNLPNCVIALNMANRIGADALMVMQNLVIVHGRPTWSSQFLISTVNTCGRFTALRYEFLGTKGNDDWGCRAWAIERATGEKLIGTDISIALAKKEGWYSKNGSKWQTMPQQMLMYRAGSWWTRAYAPELSMGLHTVEEMRDVFDAEEAEDGTFQVTTDSLRSKEPEQVDESTGEIIEGKTGNGDMWEPSADELAKIKERELAEAAK
jgi:hypothetical protein